ncbi:HAD family hydrolase [Desertivirga xinjiangensis]|uniref:HAD family hydrolase n=1 Tax=Desertivirga xinjiangensis TaxID=539206 RepID=UPI00210C9282|nr:HAD-IA family hydrolase [Pedobacter xinjiangensis]
MEVKAVIFDLDGTIANTLPLCISAFRAAIEPLIRRSLSDDEIIATFGPSEEGTIMALAPDFYDEGVSAYLRNYQDLHHNCPHPFEGMPGILETLTRKNIPIAMVTGKGKHSADISLRHFSLTKYFSIIETGSPAGPGKVQGIRAVLNKWNNINKNNVIYVGDAPSDITACREAGVPVVAAAWASTAQPEVLRSMKPDELFLTVDDFKAWLNC